MNEILKEKFKENYSPLWENFLSELQNTNVENCPLPHLPVCGNFYNTKGYKKIAFIGIDTIGSCGLQHYLKDNVENVIDEWNSDFGEDVKYLSWARQYNFWKFIFHFLSELYNVKLEDMKKVENEYIKEILQSFIWANVNSIEQFHVTAEKKGVVKGNWEKVKNASLVFDNAYNIINVFSPKVIIVLNWFAKEEWFKHGFQEIEGPIILSANLWYYFIKDTGTHIYWTKHPRYLINIGFDKIINEILESSISKNIFSS